MSRRTKTDAPSSRRRKPVPRTAPRADAGIAVAPRRSVPKPVAKVMPVPTMERISQGVRQALHLPFWVGQGTVGLLVLCVWMVFGLSPYTLVLMIPLLLAGQLHQRHWLRGEVGLSLRQAMAVPKVAAKPVSRPRAVPIVYQAQPGQTAPALALPHGGGAIRVDGLRDGGLKPARQRTTQRTPRRSVKVPHAG